MNIYELIFAATAGARLDVGHALTPPTRRLIGCVGGAWRSHFISVLGVFDLTPMKAVNTPGLRLVFANLRLVAELRSSATDSDL